MSYTPPDHEAIAFDLAVAYTPPSGSAITVDLTGGDEDGASYMMASTAPAVSVLEGFFSVSIYIDHAPVTDGPLSTIESTFIGPIHIDLPSETENAAGQIEVYYIQAIEGEIAAATDATSILTLTFIPNIKLTSYMVTEDAVGVIVAHASQNHFLSLAMLAENVSVSLAGLHIPPTSLEGGSYLILPVGRGSSAITITTFGERDTAIPASTCVMEAIYPSSASCLIPLPNSNGLVSYEIFIDEVVL